MAVSKVCFSDEIFSNAAIKLHISSKSIRNFNVTATKQTFETALLCKDYSLQIFIYNNKYMNSGFLFPVSFLQHLLP